MRFFNILFAFVLILIFGTSCVSKKVYDELSEKYQTLLRSNSELIDNNDELVAQRNALNAELLQLKDSIGRLENKKQLLEQEYTSVKKRMDELIASYEALQTQSSTQLAEKGKEISRLLNKLSQREDQLALERMQLEKLQAELDIRSQRIDELEGLINAHEEQMKALRHAVSDALQSFEGKGLHVYRKNGKVYVSMENKLLFASGSWRVGDRGRTAVEKLAEVLSRNPDIEVLIEGHTDNVPYKHSVLEDNWDLSVKRATAIVRILQSKGVSPKQITAAGRGEYLPVQTNESVQGRAANRRIEIILSPNLDKINRLLGGE
jgi:chemotaxis protein MotB